MSIVVSNILQNMLNKMYEVNKLKMFCDHTVEKRGSHGGHVRIGQMLQSQPLQAWKQVSFALWHVGCHITTTFSPWMPGEIVVDFIRCSHNIRTGIFFIVLKKDFFFFWGKNILKSIVAEYGWSVYVKVSG